MSKTSNGSSSDGSEIDAEVFGPLASISEDSLRALASRVARDVGISTDNRFDNVALVRRICGSYNIVHIMEVETTKLVIRVPAFGWGDGMSKAAADALKSQVATMRLIRKKTKVPVPEVFSFDETDKNEINAPFICLEFAQSSSGIMKMEANTEVCESKQLGHTFPLSNIWLATSKLRLKRALGIELATRCSKPLYKARQISTPIPTLFFVRQISTPRIF